MSISSSSSQDDLNKWLFTDEQLKNPPSVRAGMSLEEELIHRQKAAGLIRSISDKLWEHLKCRPNSLCTSTAMVFMHRFYMFHPFQRFPAHVMAPCALFLACKSEEQPIKLEYVIKTSFLLSNPGSSQVPEKEQLRLANELIRNENLLLQTIGFDFIVDHPHTVVIESSRELNVLKKDIELAYRLATNNLHFSKMCLKYDHRTIAIVCLKIALKTRDLEIEPKEWWIKINPALKADDLEKISLEYIEIMNRYKTFKKYINPEKDKETRLSQSVYKQRLQPTNEEPTTPDSGVSSLRS